MRTVCSESNISLYQRAWFYLFKQFSYQRALVLMISDVIDSIIEANILAKFKGFIENVSGNPQHFL